nr:carbon-nitrogen hydrolase family protein [Candidatus Njordarchaeum guaymaensis]
MNALALTLAQTSPKNCDKAHNLRVMKEISSEARRNDSDFLIFPELCLTGYVCRDLFYQLAEPLNGPSVKILCDVAKENSLTMIFGMPVEGQVKGVIYNSSVMIDQNGDVENYNKLYLPTHSVFEEKIYFRSGNEIKCFENKKCRFGLTICYDLYFPEIYRVLALEGSDVVICISASPSTRQEYFEALTKARAIENGTYLVFVNRVGIEDGLHFWGGSQVVSPNGEVLAKAPYYEEKTISVTIDLDEPRKIRSFIPTIRDLRTEILDTLIRRSYEI